MAYGLLSETFFGHCYGRNWCGLDFADENSESQSARFAGFIFRVVFNYAQRAGYRKGRRKCVKFK